MLTIGLQFCCECISTNYAIKNMGKKGAFVPNSGIKLEKVFLKKNIVAVSFLQNCALHPYYSFISFPLIEIIQA